MSNLLFSQIGQQTLASINVSIENSTIIMGSYPYMISTGEERYQFTSVMEIDLMEGAAAIFVNPVSYSFSGVFSIPSSRNGTAFFLEILLGIASKDYNVIWMFNSGSSIWIQGIQVKNNLRVEVEFTDSLEISKT